METTATLGNIKHEVLYRVAKAAFNGTLAEDEHKIPYEIIPGSQPTFRCCVYKEREIIRQRISFVKNVHPITGEPCRNTVQIIPAACEGCPITRFVVTDNCQKCLAKKCQQACNFQAITMLRDKAYIDPEKCRECGKCHDACPYNAIADLMRPCKRTCPVDAINYYAVEPAGYYSSAAFDTRIEVFEMFQGSEVMEYGNKQVTTTDDDGKELVYYDFETDVLAKYGLDASRLQYIMRYSSVIDETAEPLQSEIWFSDLQPDGYYYARSLNFNIIVKVDPATVDFLGWQTVDFLDAYALRLNIGNAAKLTVKGKLDGKLFEESFVASSQLSDSEYVVKSVRAEKLDKQLSMTYYRELFRELLAITLQGNVPSDLDKEALMAKEPYFELRIETPKYNKSDKYPEGLESITRILRFYQYTNGRALVTVETVDASGKSSGENGSFYVRVSRLDKLLGDAQKLCNGEEFSYRDKE